jgi:hypothetical protein
MSGRILTRVSLAISVAALVLAVMVLADSRTRRPAAASGRAPAAAVRTHAPLETTAAQPQPADAGFWRLMDETRHAAGNDTGRQSELLKDRLTRLSPDQRAYTWKMWGAAATIEDGCSDDCFRDFRAYVISLGRGPYEHALRNPDSLASIARDAESGDWENADNVAPDAYASVTGNDFPLDDSDLSGRPAGRPISLSESDLRRRYPRLAARFRH